MGINSAADKWKWLAINIMDHTLPRFQRLVEVATSLIETKATVIESAVDEWKRLATDVVYTLPKVDSLLEVAISLIKAMHFALFLSIIVIFLFLRTRIKHHTRSVHRNYVQFQYGDTVETRARTYANLMKFYENLVRRSGIVGTGVRKTNVLLIGAGETVEAYLRYGHEFESDGFLYPLFPQGQPFVFRTITDAIKMLDVYCTSEEKLQKTLFILLLISNRDPSLGCQQHETFQMPSSLGDHCYAIVGNGCGENGVAAHKLSKQSKGPNGEFLFKTLPLGPKNAGVCF